jgi:hypothetical protein
MICPTLCEQQLDTETDQASGAEALGRGDASLVPCLPYASKSEGTKVPFPEISKDADTQSPLSPSFRSLKATRRQACFVTYFMQPHTTSFWTNYALISRSTFALSVRRPWFNAIVAWCPCIVTLVQVLLNHVLKGQSVGTLSP